MAGKRMVTGRQNNDREADDTGRRTAAAGGTQKREKRSASLFSGCRKRDLNPHERNAHTDLNRARLPIPPFLRTNNILSCRGENVKVFFYFFGVLLFRERFRLFRERAFAFAGTERQA